MEGKAKQLASDFLMWFYLEGRSNHLQRTPLAALKSSFFFHPAALIDTLADFTYPSQPLQS
jgi:hypothetical protein